MNKIVLHKIEMMRLFVVVNVKISKNMVVC